MNIVHHNKLTFDHLEVEATLETIMSGQWAMGNRVKNLESQLCAILGTNHSCVVSNGLEAIRLSLCCLDIKPGECVIVPAYCCVAIPNAVLAAGGRPIPVDIDKNFVIDPCAAIKVAQTQNIRIAVVVHTFGYPASIKPLKSYGLKVIEDCSHGFGLDCNEGRLGNLGTLSIFSFYATKFIGAGEGGAIATNNKDLDWKLRDLRDYTDKLPSAQRLNSKMTDILAAIASVQLKGIDDFINIRREIAMHYMQSFSRLADSKVLSLPSDSCGRIWYRFPIQFCHMNAEEAIQRLEFSKIITARPIEDWRHPYYSENVYANADVAYSEVVSLPIYPTLSPEEREIVIQAVNLICS